MNNLIFFLNKCPEEFEILQVIYFAKLIFQVIFTLLPIGLIVYITIDLFKNVASNNEKEQSKNNSLIIKRIIYAVLIFFVPTIVNLVNGLLGNLGVEYATYLNCANKNDIQQVILTKAENLVEQATSTLDSTDYEQAKDVVSKIKDDKIRTEYENKLNLIEEDVTNSDENSNTPEDDKPGNTTNPSKGETTDKYHVSSVSGIKYYLYNQNDSRWENIKYRGDITIGVEGCALTSAAVIASSYDKTITPATVNDTSKIVGTDAPSTNIEYLTKNNFTCEHKTMYDKDLISDLKQGKVAVIYVGPESPFTTLHHFMALIDITKDGNEIYVGNAMGSGTGTYNRSAWYSTTDVLTGRSYSVYLCTPSQSMYNR